MQPSAPSLLVTHRGGCHCRRVRFEIDAHAVIDALDCNCSICRMTGFQHLIVPASRFRLLGGSEDLAEYTFNTGAAKHRFCRHCGIKSFYVPRSHPDGIDVNVRCLDAGTIASVNITLFDDADREAATAAIAHLSSTSAQHLNATHTIRVVDYAPQWRADFARLNLEWLEECFVVEQIDRDVLLDPETHILGPGGHILFAVDGGEQAIGTVALKQDVDGVYELTKMAVDPAMQGMGIGRQLMLAALAAFERLGGRELFLESNSKLEPALRLYESVGFAHRPAPRPGSHYQRSDIYMVWDPKSSRRRATSPAATDDVSHDG